MESTYQKHLTSIDEITEVIQGTSELNGVDPITWDVATFRLAVQKNRVFLIYKKRKVLIVNSNTHTLTPLFFQDFERNLLSEAKGKLEDVTFDIQCFISENMPFLSPAQSGRLLKSLSSAQRGFREQAETLVSQRSAWDVLLRTREREDQEKVCLRTCGKKYHNSPVEITAVVGLLRRDV